MTGSLICDHDLYNTACYTWKNLRQNDTERGRADEFIRLVKPDGSHNASFAIFGVGAIDSYIYAGYNDYDGLNLRISATNLSWGDNTILHAGNFNSYAPKLDGTGASGTWGINISGNAATAGSVDWSGVTNRPTSLPANGGTADYAISSGTANTTSHILYNNNFDKKYGAYAIFQQYAEISDFPHNGWFNSIKMLHNNSLGYFTEIATSFSGEDGMWRRRLNYGEQSGWYKMLDSGNFNSYAPKLDGTGASGTWGINISGNADTATNVAWSGVTGKPTKLSDFTDDLGSSPIHTHS